MNRLSKERSPYLLHASKQKIHWYPWCEEAFLRAKEENKPVFLSSGAMWCHWCHVMSKESFEDDEVAEILNKYFISIKLDRDEKPDIDKHYQRAVTAMTGKGGWPLSVFLTPDKRPFYGGTYFPPDERYGLPSFKRLLITIGELYKSKTHEVNKYSEEIIKILNQKVCTKGKIDPSIIDRAMEIILNEMDTQHGGFGHAPKFPMPGVTEFLLNRYCLTKDERIGEFLKKTLTNMANGGIYDQIGGGFHRYSVDNAWIIPHFEKMLEDNVWLLRNYLDAFSVFKEEKYRDVASGIIKFIMEELSDSEGGFYASLSADANPNDEGGYFTWTESELKELLDEKEYEAVIMHYTDERGTMHNNPQKKVLFVAKDMGEISKHLNIDTHELSETLKKAKEKLLSHRIKREKPFIDKTKYTSLNGIAISAFFKAYTIFRDERLKDFALLSLEKILKENTDNEMVFHSQGVKGLLSDYISLADACISAYEVLSDITYLKRAEKIIKSCIERFWDREEGGFFDSEDPLLGIRLKGIEDSPHPSSNAQAVLILLKLSFITEDHEYRRYAEDTLDAFAHNIEKFGTHGGYFFNAICFYFHMLELTISNDTPYEFKKFMLLPFYPYKILKYSDSKGFVRPCYKGTCYSEVKTKEDILKFLEKEIRFLN